MPTLFYTLKEGSIRPGVLKQQNSSSVLVLVSITLTGLHYFCNKGLLCQLLIYLSRHCHLLAKLNIFTSGDLYYDVTTTKIYDHIKTTPVSFL